MSADPSRHPDATLDEAVAVCHGVLWLDANIHNYGTDAWREYFKACVRDARRVVGLPAANRPPESA